MNLNLDDLISGEAEYEMRATRRRQSCPLKRGARVMELVITAGECGRVSNCFEGIQLQGAPPGLRALRAKVVEVHGADHGMAEGSHWRREVNELGQCTALDLKYVPERHIRIMAVIPLRSLCSTRVYRRTCVPNNFLEGIFVQWFSWATKL